MNVGDMNHTSPFIGVPSAPLPNVGTKYHNFIILSMVNTKICSRIDQYLKRVLKK